MATLKRYKHTRYGIYEEECQAIEYTGDNIHEICKAFPTIEIQLESYKKDLRWIKVGAKGRVDALVRPGDFVVRYVRKQDGHEWFTCPFREEFLNAVTECVDDIWDRIGTTLTKETDDSIYKFAKQYNIDYRLCRTVFKKCEQHYTDGMKILTKEMLDYLVKAFNDYDICIDSDTFVKFNFLLDKWVEKYGTTTIMQIQYCGLEKSKLPLLKDMHVYGDGTLRDFFKSIVLLREDAIDFIPDSAISRYCEDNGVYLTEFGIVQFRGEI